MPFFSVTKGCKKQGLQTFARASRLQEPLKNIELEYLSYRDWYMQQVGIKAQFEEALHQAKTDKREDDITLFGNKIYHIESKLTDARPICCLRFSFSR